MCTNLVWEVADNKVDGTVSNICRNKVPSGKLLVFNATLKGDTAKPGGCGPRPRPDPQEMGLSRILFGWQATFSKPGRLARPRVTTLCT